MPALDRHCPQCFRPMWGHRQPERKRAEKHESNNLNWRKLLKNKHKSSQPIQNLQTDSLRPQCIVHIGLWSILLWYRTIGRWRCSTILLDFHVYRTAALRTNSANKGNNCAQSFPEKKCGRSVLTFVRLKVWLVWKENRSVKKKFQKFLTKKNFSIFANDLHDETCCLGEGNPLENWNSPIDY